MSTLQPYEHGVVAAKRRSSAEAGVEILKSGGSAIDAAVATALAECVSAPADNGFGGYGGSMIIYLAREGRVAAIDYNTRAPMGVDAESFNSAGEGEACVHPPGALLKRRGWNGWSLIGVPGTVAGLNLALERFGTKSWREVFQPALRLVRNGVVVNDALQRVIRNGAGTLDAEARAELMPEGRVPEVGEVLPMRRFQQAVEMLCEEGAEAFYRGRIARAIVERIRQRGGVMTLDDMARYEAREVQPISARFLEYEIFTTPPANGGLSVLQALMLFERAKQRVPEFYEALVRIYRVVWRERLSRLGDGADAAAMLAQSHIEALAAELGKERSTDGWRDSSRGTIHISVADAEGNMVALTQTMGGGLPESLNFVPEVGLILNHGVTLFEPRREKPNSLAPWKQPLNNMCPTLVMRDGEPLYALGSPGARRIISAVSQIIILLLHSGMTMKEAIEAPRIHCEESGAVLIEKSVPHDAMRRISVVGGEVKLVDEIAGPAHAVGRVGDGLCGATDFRGGGGAVEGF